MRTKFEAINLKCKYHLENLWKKWRKQWNVS